MDDGDITDLASDLAPGDKRDLGSVSTELMETAKARYESIHPLLEIRKKGKLKRKDVEARAKEVGVTGKTLYNWLKAYDGAGSLRGLFSRTYKKGNRTSRLDPDVEEQIERVINDVYLKGMASIKSCYDNALVDACEEKDLKTPSYDAFRGRVRKIVAQEFKGTQGLDGRHVIPRSMMGGELLIGKKPLELALVDHSKVDISLVDQEYRECIGGPWLTLAIDYYSRMIYGYSLSFDSSSQLSVGTALLTGILPKKEVIERVKPYFEDIDSAWEIHGLPDFVQVDNAREFEAKSIRDFCLMYRINYSFRPVKRPDLGGRIERMFRTINEKIRDENLPGYAPPLKKRPPDYDPDKHAAMTLPEFEAWLVHFIVETYHNNEHQSLGMSPAECYRRGMEGKRVRLPEDLARLKFDILPSITPTLQPYGVKFECLNYNHEVLSLMRRLENGKKRTVLLRYDPRDIRWLHYYHKPQERYIKIRARGGFLAYLVLNRFGNQGEVDTPVSLSELKAVKGNDKGKGRDINAVLLGKKVKERREVVENGSMKTKSARRMKETKRQHKKILPKSSPPKVDLKEELPEWDELSPEDARDIDVL